MFLTYSNSYIYIYIHIWFFVSNLFSKRKTYLDYKSTRINVDLSIDAVTACLQVLDITNKVYELIRNGQRFAALKSLDDLQNIHLKEVQDFGFAQLINKNVPALTKVVRTDSLSDLDSWFQALPALCQKVGFSAFEHIESLRATWRKIQSKQPGLLNYKFNTPVELTYRTTDYDYLKNKHVSEDLSSLYECSLVHNSLGLAFEFHDHFETQLKMKQDEVIPFKISIDTTSDATTTTSLDELKRVLASAAGFFIVDKTISRQIKGLRPSENVEEFWLENSQKLISKLSPALKGVENSDVLAEIVRLLILFIHVLEVFDCDVLGLKDLVASLFKDYIVLTKKDLVKAFNTQLDEDDYMPMVCNSRQEYQEIAKRVWLKHPITEGETAVFPRVLYFSQIYLFFCTATKDFIHNLEIFMDDLNVDNGVIEDLIRDTVDDILSNKICKEFENRLSSTTREQIVQIVLNLEHFEYASSQIERLLQQHRRSSSTLGVSLEATKLFLGARKFAEARIFELVNAIVDDFLEIADYNWLSTKPSTEPSSYLVELINFLKTMVNSTLVNLPSNIKSFLYLDAFDHLASSLLRFLVDASDEVTPVAVSNFDMDIKYLEEFVTELAVDSNEMSLTTIFTELRQSVDLLRSEDMSEYNDVMVRMKKYDRVKPENAQALFQKAARAIKQNDKTPGHSPHNSTNSTTTTGMFKRYYKAGVDRISGNQNEKM